MKHQEDSARGSVHAIVVWNKQNLLTFFVYYAIMVASGRCLWIEIVKMVSEKGHGRVMLCPLKLAGRFGFEAAVLPAYCVDVEQTNQK